MSTQDWTYPLTAALYARFPPLPDFAALLQRAYAPSGFTRLAAVNEFGRLGNAAALPALIVRSNDWVEPVRDAAVATLRKLAVTENAAAFAMALPLLYRLRQCRRANHAPLIDAIEDFLCRAEHAAVVVAAITDEQPRVARACLNLAIARRLADPATLARQGLKQRDLATRTAVAPLIAALDGAEREAMLDIALADKSMPLRRAALRVRLAQTPDRVDALPYLFDRHLAIRLLAAAHRQQRGHAAAADYADALARAGSAQQRRIALWGLGEYGSSSDAARIRPYLDDPSAAVRGEALRALARRGDDDLRGIALKALGDAEASVRNEAGRVARRARLQFDAAELLPLLATSTHGLATTLIAAHQLSNKWERLILLLHLRARDTEGRALFLHGVQNWEKAFNHSFVAATARQREELHTLLRQAAESPLHDRTDHRWIEQLRWLLAQ